MWMTSWQMQPNEITQWASEADAHAGWAEQWAVTGAQTQVLCPRHCAAAVEKEAYHGVREAT